jgi:dephospho-CoA kinase
VPRKPAPRRTRVPELLRVALTGGIATGKSYVRGQFEKLGVPTIDSDILAREAVAPGTPGLAAVVRRFGSEMLDGSGQLDRKKLGALVFADPEKRKALEEIIHPEVRRVTDGWFAHLAPDLPFAIADIPLLYEVGRDQDFDAVIVTAVDPEEQVRRVMKRDGLSESEARQRLAAQMPIAEKIARADHVIRTDGTYAETNRQVREIFDRLSRS